MLSRKKPSRRKDSGGAECVGLHNVRQYLHLLCLYKADMVAVLATGQRLVDIEDVQVFVERYNGWVATARGLPSKREDFLLAPEHFEQCDVPLSSALECLVEAREFMRNFASPFKPLRGMFSMVQAFSRMIRLADKTMKVELKGGSKVFAVVDALDALGASEVMKLNREFYALAKDRGLGPTELYVLAASLLALRGAVGGRLFLQTAKFFSSAAVDGGALPLSYARFYVELVRAGSEYTDSVASSLLTYMNIRDPARLYEVVRNMLHAMNRKRLKKGEEEALTLLLEHEAGG